jgi:hypothetical protein
MAWDSVFGGGNVVERALNNMGIFNKIVADLIVCRCGS